MICHNCQEIIPSEGCNFCAYCGHIAAAHQHKEGLICCGKHTDPLIAIEQQVALGESCRNYLTPPCDTGSNQGINKR